MLTGFFIFIGSIPILYILLSVYPAILIHTLLDSRTPVDVDDFLKMTYVPYIFKQIRKGKEP